MVEVLLESGSQEVAVAENGSRAGTPTECAEPKDSQISSDITEDLTPVQEFYNGQSIFITGGTGFLGKLLIEKLLRRCPGVATIFLLVRPKKGKDVHQRTEEIFDDPLFAKLKEERPKFRHQIVAIAGDCSQVDLGISATDRSTLIQEVSIVFHVAATVRFDEKIKLAVEINVRSLNDVMTLCKEMSQLKSFIHVSTAYANCPHKKIEEKFYDSPIDSDKLISLTDCLDEKLLEDITPQLLGAWPNTYAFTKAVAEDVVRKKSGDLPVGIFRPAIVISTYREPIRGWIDNLYGPTGVAAGAGTGLLRSLHCDGGIQANIVPADLTVNALITCAWDTANVRKCNKSPENIPIYNYVAKDNPITFDQLKSLSAKYGVDVPTVRAVWYYSFRNNKYRLVHLLYVYLLHLLPALLIDTVTVCVGRKPRFLKVYKKIHKFMDVLSYFATNEWTFSNDRLNALILKLETRDRKEFFCDMKEMDWDTFFQTYIQGIRLYLIKDPLDTLPQARAKWQRLYWSHQLIKLIFAYAGLRIAWFATMNLLRVFDYV